MRLRLKNINKIKEASIELNALTVIAGVNDSGKSTVGKMLFSVIKSIQNMNKHYGERQRDRVDAKLRALYRKILVANRSNAVEVCEKLELPAHWMKMRQLVLSEDAVDQEWFDRKISEVETLELMPRYVQGIVSALKELKDELYEDKSPTVVLKKELAHSFKSEFKNNICSYNTKESLIAYSDVGNDDLLHVSLDCNEIKSISLNQIDNLQFRDATMVESPLYLHLLDSLVDGFTFAESSSRRPLWGTIVNYHVKDMAMKLYGFRYLDHSTLFMDERVEMIKRIIDGSFVYDEKQRDIYLQKGKHRHSPVNVASGIKTFGVLQMLLETGAIDENRMLIWDEPENHLHPEWQIKFAQVLVELAKSGITILVSSHSPYFIQALRYYTEKLQMNKYVNYYLAEEDERDGLTRIMNMTQDMNAIFMKLARPMNDIINIGK